MEANIERLHMPEIIETGLVYDPPEGWMYGFPKPYKPYVGESLADTLLRDGYPQRKMDIGTRHCRFLGARENIDKYVP